MTAYFMRTRKGKLGVLQYCRMQPSGGKRVKWGFKLKNPDGSTIIESAKSFDSLSKAEQGFFKVVKAMATNQYSIDYPAKTSAARN